jgi:hypothetical protein
MDMRAWAGYAASWTTEGTSGVKTVTEAEWLACTDLYIMLAFLGDKVSDRKRWLTACACCRSIPGFLAGDAGRNCLEVVEARLIV